MSNDPNAPISADPAAAAPNPETQAAPTGPVAPSRPTGPAAGNSLKFALAAAEMASNTRSHNVVVMDLRGRSPVTEFFVIATGSSARQMRTVADEIEDLGQRMDFKAWQKSGYESARWILVDFVHVVVHVFDPESRGFYDLEMLWGDAPRIDWRAALGLPPALPEPEPAPFGQEAGVGDTAWEEIPETSAAPDAGDNEMLAPVEVETPAPMARKLAAPIARPKAPARKVAKAATAARPAAKKLVKKPAKKAAKLVKKAVAKKAVVKKITGKKSAAKKTAAKKPVVKKVAARKAKKAAPVKKTVKARKPKAKSAGKARKAPGRKKR
jgi:ribosome-associated protein